MNYIEADSIDWWRFVRVAVRADGEGGHNLRGITHYTRIPTTNPMLQKEEGWEDIIYLKRIAPKKDEYSPKNGSGGYVYVLTNESYPGLCKVGFTTTKPATRIRQINGSGVIVNWDVVFIYRCERPYDLEQDLHSRLDPVRYREDREFFQINVREVVELIENIGSVYTPF